VLRIRDVYPGSRISDLGSRTQKQQQKRGVKKNLLYSTFLCSQKFNKIENYFSFEVLKKKIWANFQRIIELFTQKIVTKLSKIWVWDPRSESGKNLFRIPDPGVKKAPDPGSATLIFIHKTIVTRSRYLVSEDTFMQIVCKILFEFIL
jgi:hypothetical protein